MKFSALIFSFICLAQTDFSEVCGNYYGEKDDYATCIKLYDDSVFRYEAKREFPFEVSEGTWTLKNDTITLNSIPCPNPDALTHPPVRTYKTFVNAKFIYRNKTITPVTNGKLKKSEVLSAE